MKTEAPARVTVSIDKVRSRWAVGSLFFLHGLCFSSWGARIPAIQQSLGLSDAGLGSVLFALPVGSLLSMPLAAWLISLFGSKKIVSMGIVLYALVLLSLGLVTTVWQLALLLVVFGMSSNLVNIGVNTQALVVEELCKKSVMGSLHGLWSSAGFVGAAIGTVMIASRVHPLYHFILIALIVCFGALVNVSYLLPDPVREEDKPKFFVLPDKKLFYFGLIAFFSMICEGTMFDWSGVYFKKIVLAEPAWIGAGYTAFMSTMAGTRFFADRLAEKWGLPRVLQVSGALIFLGLIISVALPFVPTALLGFFLVGAGTSSVVPLVFSAAGKGSSLSPSAAIAAVSTIGFLGFLVGPPLIGWVAGASSLRVSFSIVALLGLGILIFSRRTT